MTGTASQPTADVDFDALNNVEEAAYQEGYRQGFDHGALHGTFEGRDLGRSKGFELWEEVGFYQGLAMTWKQIFEQAQSSGHMSRKSARQLQHVSGLLRLISFFPTINKSSDPTTDLTGVVPPALSPSSDPRDEDDAPTGHEGEAEDNDDVLAGLDMLALLEKIRAKYRLTCSVLSMPPRQAGNTSLVSSDSTSVVSSSAPPTGASSGSVRVAGQLVDPSQLRY
ncbi:hypothetical protein BCV70DRAFT_202573 [Testicularia cyperi]|uniref:Essential protein Yae1 N-terminal domain-containing protein n=1 Tax=Testicularia cyperi TaxID=1882483 RepID=A0A317XJ19_9BASI|nr:hypothetical protein BCV70DRAFT_202573 [Testicularia cyperi]